MHTALLREVFMTRCMFEDLFLEVHQNLMSVNSKWWIRVVTGGMWPSSSFSFSS